MLRAHRRLTSPRPGQSWAKRDAAGASHRASSKHHPEAHEKDKKIGEEEEEEYVLLELDDCLHSDIPPNAPYVLSGLDTLTPTLVIGDGLKMIGEYEETVGTCYLFSESVHQSISNVVFHTLH